MFTPQAPFISHAGPERSRTAVLFIHGITEGPEQFRDMAAWANATGLDAMALVLPGHGGTARDFARSGREAWEEHVCRQVERHGKEYTGLILAGHSMGGLLSLLAGRHHQGITGIVTIGCPLHVRVAPRAVRNLLGLRYLPSLGGSDLEAMRRAVNVAPGATLGYLHWLPRLRDLFALMHDARRTLPHLNLPLLAIQGARDELVDARRSLACYRERVHPDRLHTLVLPESTHFRYPATDLQALREAFTTFCSRLPASGINKSSE